jgi:predicted nucleic acid-binding protein
LNLTIDTFAWLELIRGTAAGEAVRTTIREADKAFTPAIVLAEVAGACYRSGFSDGLVTGELSAIREASTIVPIDSRVAISAAHVLDELRSSAKERRISLPGLADALILATAREIGTRLLTGDSHFQDFPESVWVR